MLVIDQHALHERILFDQLKSRIRDGRLERQRLLIPEPVEMPGDQAARLLEQRQALSELGLEIEFSGNTVVTVIGHARPAALPNSSRVADHLMAHDPCSQSRTASTAC